MRVGVAKYKVERDKSIKEYLEILRKSLPNHLDLFVGPDYALSHRFDQVSTIAEGRDLREYLLRLSRHFPDTTIIPGTLPLQINKKEMQHLALVYQNGREMAFAKQTDHGEEETAEKAGLEYKKGEAVPAVFSIDGKKAWIHICGDRGRTQNVYDADLEIILAQDIKAGFHFGAATPRNPRHLILSDSYHPKAEILRFSPPNTHKLLKPIEEINSLRIFEI